MYTNYLEIRIDSFYYFFQIPNIQKLFEDELSISTEAKYECLIQSKAPNQDIHWYLNNEIIGQASRIELNLTRKDFNKSLSCSVQHKNNENEPIGGPLKSSNVNLILDLDPQILNVDKVDSNIYELQTESWPPIEFLRIVSNNQIEIFVHNLTCHCFTRPDHSQSWFVQEIIWKRNLLQASNSGQQARSHFSITFKPNISTVHKTLNIEMGNSKNTAKHTLEFKNDVSIIPSMIKSSSITYIIVSVTIIVIICTIAIVLICKFKRQISEFFQCGEYHVPQDDDPLDNEEKAEKKKLPTESDF